MKPCGLHDFLVKFVKLNLQLPPGIFEYNSTNAGVLGWILPRLIDRRLNLVIEAHIRSKIGFEHDVLFIVDRVFIPIATGEFNAAARDTVRFGMMIRDRGVFRAEKVLLGSWLEQYLRVSDQNRVNMQLNGSYSAIGWHAYRNMWWILDAVAEEFCAVRIHGQVMYINRSTDTGIVWLSSRRDAAPISVPEFLFKLDVGRALVRYLGGVEDF